MIGLARLGGPVACLGLALLLVATSRRDRLAGLGFAGFGACLLAAALAPGKAFEAAGGAAVALLVACGLAAVYRRLAWLLPLLALAAVPARVSALGHQLLVPLYVVIAGAALLLGWQIAHGDDRERELRLATWPLAALVGWTGVSIVWSKDVHEGAIELLAFYVPFTLLALAIARLPWSELGPRALYLELTLMALAFASLGFYQYQTREIFQNPKVIYANAYAPIFRVNSVFWDPSVYGRFLVVAMIPSIVLIIRGRHLRLAWAAAGVIAVLWGGLFFSFSQSSFAALLVVAVGAAFVTWRWRAIGALVLAAAVLAGIAASQPQIRKSIQHHTRSGLNSATSGRASLVANGIRIAAHYPVAGVGVGGFKRAYAERLHLKGKEPKKAASHDTPVTVAAETGLVGLGLFGWLVGALFLQALRTRGRLALVAGLGLAAILCHSLFYNDFFEDPMMWGLLGLLAIGVPTAAVREERAPVSVEPKEAVPV